MEKKAPLEEGSCHPQTEKSAEPLTVFLHLDNYKRRLIHGWLTWMGDEPHPVPLCALEGGYNISFYLIFCLVGWTHVNMW